MGSGQRLSRRPPGVTALVLGRGVSKYLHSPPEEGSSSGPHSSSQRLGSPAVGQPEALTPTAGAVQMTVNFPGRKTLRGREERGAKPGSREHFLHKAPAPRGRLTSLCALGHSLGLWQGRTGQTSLHTRTHARTHHPLSPRLHLITPDAL